MEQIWTFIKALAKGIRQGLDQFISNDLHNFVPLFIVAAVIIVVVLLKRIIGKFKTK